MDRTTAFLTDVWVLFRKRGVKPDPERFFGHSASSAFLPTKHKGRGGAREERQKERDS